MDLKKIKNSIGPNVRQHVLVIQKLYELDENKKYKLIDVGAAERYLKKFIPKNVSYYSLDCSGKQDYVFDLDKGKIPIKNNSFDIIVCLETLEHTLYPHKVMQELVRIAKPNALFLLSMPNEYNFYCRLNFLFNKKTFVQEPFQVIEKHLHIQIPRVEDIIKFFSTYVKIEEINYQWYSRTGGHNRNFKGGLFVFMDNLINLIKNISPSLFTRSVIVKGRLIK